MEFVLISNGTFLKGEKNTKERLIEHKVTITDDFWLARTEVTQEQWCNIMGNEEFHPGKPSPFRITNSQYPVVSISYHDVQHFLEKLNKPILDLLPQNFLLNFTSPGT